MIPTRPCSRRDFLSTAAAVGAASLLPGPEGYASTLRVPAVDTHTHFYDPARPQGVPWPRASDKLLYRPHLPEELRSLATPHAVVGTVVVEASPWVEDNQWVLDLARDDPFILGLIGNVAPGAPEFAAKLDRFAGNPLFLGLRIGAGALARGVGAPPFDADLRRLAERGLTLDLLGGPSMLPDVLRAARAAPGLRIVIDHLPFAAWDGDPAAARGALLPVSEITTVYAKVSNVVRSVDGRVVEGPAFYRPGLDVLWEIFGPDRLVFGSNWPVSGNVAPYPEVHRVVADYFHARGRRAAERFFWRNSLAAYRWIPRGAAAGLVGEPG